MQKVLFLLSILAAATACTNNQSGRGTPDAGTSAAPASTAPVSADAASSDADAVGGPVTFSLTIDGQTVAGTSVGNFRYNRGQTAIDENNKPEFRFVLADIKSPDGKPTRTVIFQSPIKVVSHHVDCSGDDHFYGLEITFEDGSFDQYCGDDVTLNVTEVSDTRVKGNFSGKFTLTGRARQKTIQADCRFDIPRAK